MPKHINNKTKKLEAQLAGLELDLTQANQEIAAIATYARNHFEKADEKEQERLVEAATEFIRDGEHELSTTCAALGIPEFAYHKIRTRQQLKKLELGG